MPIGTIVNVVAVIAGSLIGVMLHKNFPDRIKEIVFQGIGLATLVIGMQMAFKVQNLLVLIFSILIGVNSYRCSINSQLGRYIGRRISSIIKATQKSKAIFFIFI